MGGKNTKIMISFNKAKYRHWRYFALFFVLPAYLHYG